jgi:hypothetical protein
MRLVCFTFSPESEIGGERRAIAHGDYLGLFRRGLAVGGHLTLPGLSGHEAVLSRTIKHDPDLLRPLLAEGHLHILDRSCLLVGGERAALIRVRLGKERPHLRGGGFIRRRVAGDEQNGNKEAEDRAHGDQRWRGGEMECCVCVGVAVVV